MDRMVKIAALVTVRNSSTRLPGKAIQYVTYRKRSVEMVLDRAKLTGYEVIICTSTDPSDDVFLEIAKLNQVGIYRGNLLNKITRWYDCINENDLDYVLLIDGDDLLYDYNIGHRAINQLINAGLEMVSAPKDINCGLFTYAINKNAAFKLFNAAKYYPNTDVITEFIHMSDIIINDINLYEWERNKNMRLTLDYPEDLEMFRKFFQQNDYQVDGKRVVDFFENHPEIAEINYFRQNEFLINQQKFNQRIQNDTLNNV
jgi:spore coat polysaccharide biosynthesis protein SpsF